MPAARLEAAFRATRSKGRLALVPFLTAGFPDPARTVEAAEALAAAGAAALELGIPFSDPIADGPVIQVTSQQALARGVTVESALEMAAQIHARTGLPLVAMTYANPVLRCGVERFARRAAESGVDGVILTDVPPEELSEAWAALRAAGLGCVRLVTPLTRRERLARILEGGGGYVYVVSRTGVTGRGEAAAGLADLVQELRGLTALPVAVGFGIEGPEQVRRLAGLADGVIVGSALLRRMQAAGPEGAAAAAGEFLRGLQ
ncbi:MAG TPA: tryptophan synthase subunit alpha [Candidatus Saccharimonadales bacterium]|nr:tryptophan synthase subunit alpha [Candidatus Saccharimonadales bacterium]